MHGSLFLPDHTFSRLQFINCVRTVICRMLLCIYSIFSPWYQIQACRCGQSTKKAIVHVILYHGYQCRPISSGSITNTLVFPHYSQMEAESFIRGIWGSFRCIYTAQICPKAQGRETRGKGNVTAFIYLLLSAVPRCHCLFIMFFFFYIFVKMMSSPLFIMEINNLNGSTSTAAPFLVRRRTVSKHGASSKNCRMCGDHMSLSASEGSY